MKRQKGFTLVELLVVIAIIGILSTLAIVSLGSVKAKARDTKVISDINAIKTVLEVIGSDGSYSGAGPCTDSYIWTCTNLAPYIPSYTEMGYQQAFNANDYKVQFDLEVGIGSFGNGTHCLTQDGITSGACTW